MSTFSNGSNGYSMKHMNTQVGEDPMIMGAGATLGNLGVSMRTNEQLFGRHRGSGIRQNNFGFDTSEGFYKVIEGDHLAFRYETIKEIGRGSYGQVIHCIDHKLGGK